MRLLNVEGEICQDMATFILLSSLTDDGAQTLLNEPERIHEVNAELARMGVRVLSQFAVLGLYDFVNIVEAPDNVTIARVSAELAARGSVRITTLPAIPIDEYVAGLRAGR
jgi:uncharacterized protein with GYD domain